MVPDIMDKHFIPYKHKYLIDDDYHSIGEYSLNLKITYQSDFFESKFRFYRWIINNLTYNRVTYGLIQINEVNPSEVKYLFICINSKINTLKTVHIRMKNERIILYNI